MRVLLDECCPKPLLKALSPLEVHTVEMAGLKGFKNGELLKAAEGRFEVLVTADKNLRYQQNLKGRTIAIVELPWNSWPRLKPIVGRVRIAVETAVPGGYTELLDEIRPI